MNERERGIYIQIFDKEECQFAQRQRMRKEMEIWGLMQDDISESTGVADDLLFNDVGALSYDGLLFGDCSLDAESLKPLIVLPALSCRQRGKGIHEVLDPVFAILCWGGGAEASKTGQLTCCFSLMWITLFRIICNRSSISAE